MRHWWSLGCAADAGLADVGADVAEMAEMEEEVEEEEDEVEEEEEEEDEDATMGVKELLVSIIRTSKRLLIKE
jgi:hypothetical protein